VKKGRKKKIKTGETKKRRNDGRRNRKRRKGMK
jgi:hypothetical protein